MQRRVERAELGGRGQGVARVGVAAQGDAGGEELEPGGREVRHGVHEVARVAQGAVREGRWGWR